MDFFKIYWEYHISGLFFTRSFHICRNFQIIFTGEHLKNESNKDYYPKNFINKCS